MQFQVNACLFYNNVNEKLQMDGNHHTMNWNEFQILLQTSASVETKESNSQKGSGLGDVVSSVGV